MGCDCDLSSGKATKAMENHHRNSEFSHAKLGDFL
jgi:hypothetical protein